jgi:hypothetical protein
MIIVVVVKSPFLFAVNRSAACSFYVSLFNIKRITVVLVVYALLLIGI